MKKKRKHNDNKIYLFTISKRICMWTGMLTLKVIQMNALFS